MSLAGFIVRNTLPKRNTWPGMLWEICTVVHKRLMHRTIEALYRVHKNQQGLGKTFIRENHKTRICQNPCKLGVQNREVV